MKGMRRILHMPEKSCILVGYPSVSYSLCYHISLTGISLSILAKKNVAIIRFNCLAGV